MVKSKERIIRELKQQFAGLKKDPRILGLILYGSIAQSQHHIQSDIDLCIVAPNQNQHDIYKFIVEAIKQNIEKYDIRFFEELPLLIRADIIEKGIIIISQDVGELTEYFFFSTRKELDDYRYQMEHLV